MNRTIGLGRMNLEGLTHITFDCYGTLIDWETGILEQAMPRLGLTGAKNVEAEKILRAYAKHEAALEAGPFRPYREILGETLRRIGSDLGITLSGPICADFAQSLADWPPFSDTIESLARLAGRYQLVILSNVDDDLFAHTARRLGNPFQGIITSEQVRSYKPALGHFETARKRFKLSPTNWLHVAQSLYHDHVPAKSLGLRTVWVDRSSRLAGTGIAPPASVTPDAHLTTLAQVVKLLST